MPEIEVTAQYEAAVGGIGSKINIMVENPFENAILRVQHLYWIDKNDNGRLMLFNDLITFPRDIAAGESK